MIAILREAINLYEFLLIYEAARLEETTGESLDSVGIIADKSTTTNAKYIKNT